jgi:hypothetical protein
MAVIWRSHQVCQRCGWAGLTGAHRLNLLSGFLYIFAAIVLFALDGFGVWDVKQVLRGPACVVALLWFYGVPLLLWRLNACGGCRTRMAVELVPGNVRVPPGAHDDGKGVARAVGETPRSILR